MEFPSVKTFKFDDKTIEVRPYILSDEMKAIVYTVAQEKDPIMRKNIKDILVVRYCTNFQGFDKDEIDFAEIDLHRVNGFFKKVYENIDEQYVIQLNSFIHEIDSVEHQISEIKDVLIATINNIGAKVDKYTKGDIDKTITKFVKQLKEVKSIGETNKE